MKKTFDRIIPWTLLLPLFTFGLSVGMVVGIIADYVFFAQLCMVLSVLALGLQALWSLVLFFCKRFLWGFIHLGLFLLMCALSFVGVVIVSVGQHHPPKHDVEDSLLIVPEDYDSLEDISPITTEQADSIYR